MVLLRWGLELCFRTFFHGEATETLERVWGILVYNLMSDSLPSGKLISSLSTATLTRHSLFFALKTGIKVKLDFPTDLFLLTNSLNCALLEMKLESAGGSMGLQRLGFLLCLNLGIKSNTVMSYVFAIHPHFRQDLTVLHCFQIKDDLEEKTDRKFDHKRRFTTINVRI